MGRAPQYTMILVIGALVIGAPKQGPLVSGSYGWAVLANHQLSRRTPEASFQGLLLAAGLSAQPLLRLPDTPRPVHLSVHRGWLRCHDAGTGWGLVAMGPELFFFFSNPFPPPAAERLGCQYGRVRLYGHSSLFERLGRNPRAQSSCRHTRG